MSDYNIDELYAAVQQFKLYVQQNFPYKQTIFEGTIDPSVVGFNANPASLFFQKDMSGNLINIWIKTTYTNTDWELLFPISPGLYLEHTQSVAASTWTVAHNFGKYPVVSVLTPGGLEVDAEIANLSLNVIEIRFASPQIGKAILK